MNGIGLEGEGLVFVISQPRAGSTLLQRMLGSHPEIHTVSEPWLMLHPIYALRSEGHEAEYNARGAWKGLQGFIQTLPDGQDVFNEGIRRMYSYLYTQAITTSGKRYFLDKTPRYYFIIPDLYRIFPKAHYIILLRNPLAVLSSIINTWTKHWFALYNHKHDLLQAPRLLLKGIKDVGEQGVVVHYEELVKNPEDVTRRICSKLGISFVHEMVKYGSSDLPHWGFGDQNKVYEHSVPTRQYTDKWIHAISNPQVWRLAHDYLPLLGRETVDQMGYSYEGLSAIIREHKPHRTRLWFTVSMPWLLRKPLTEYNAIMKYFLFLFGTMSRQGVVVGVSYAIRRLISELSKSE
jgi:hypothetical protein